MSNSNPQIYVCDIEAYNNGRLRGVWIELYEGIDAEAIGFAIEHMLSKYDREEWRIDDYDEFPKIQETNVDVLADIANLIHEHGLLSVQYWIDRVGESNLKNELAGFEDYHYGSFETLEEFAMTVYDELLPKIEAIKIGQTSLDYYVDWSKAARDLLVNDFYSERIEGRIEVFWRI